MSSNASLCLSLLNGKTDASLSEAERYLQEGRAIRRTVSRSLISCQMKHLI